VPRVDAIALDVDGVLTDNSVFWGENGEELKRFSFADIMGVARARRLGVVFALISGEDSPIVSRFATKLGIEHVYKGCKDKALALRQFSASAGIGLESVCFMGNDLNDIDAMQLAGLSAAPSDAHKSALGIASKVTSRPGGHGAVRELIDELVLDDKTRQAS